MGHVSVLASAIRDLHGFDPLERDAIHACVHVPEISYEASLAQAPKIEGYTMVFHGAFHDQEEAVARTPHVIQTLKTRVDFAVVRRDKVPWPFFPWNLFLYVKVGTPPSTLTETCSVCGSKFTMSSPVYSFVQEAVESWRRSHKCKQMSFRQGVGKSR